MMSDTEQTRDSDPNWRDIRNGCLWEMPSMLPWWLALPGFAIGGIIAAVRRTRNKQ